MKRAFCLLLSIIIISLCGITPLAQTGMRKLTLEYQGWYGMENDAYIVYNNGTNNICVDDEEVFTFDYSAHIKLNSGETAALVFGYTSTNGEIFNAVELRDDGENVNLTSFLNGHPSYGWPNNYAFQDVKAAGNLSKGVDFRIVMDEKSVLSVYVNGVSAVTHDFSAEGSIPYQQGRLGMLTYKGEAQISEIKAYTDDAFTGFVTNIAGDWSASAGSWSEISDGMLGNNEGLGDVFYLSTQRCSSGIPFILEGDISLQSGTAAGIVFGITDASSPQNCWYCVNVDKQQQITKLFKNTGSQAWEAGRKLTSDEIGKTDFSIKLVYLGNGRLSYYLDGAYVASHQDISFVGGNMGIMTFGSQAVFSKLEFTEISVPKLSGLSLSGADLKEDFSEDVFAYSAVVPYETASITVTASAADGYTLYINGDNTASGEESEKISLEAGKENEVMITVCDNTTGVENRITVKLKREQDPLLAYTEEYRPQYHYSQELNWCNDPNGMVYFNGEWHLFYQYSETGKDPSGKKSWGHAVSADLIHWQELAPAISPDSYGEIYSGCAVVDENNTSGLFDDTAAKQGIVAFYTVNSSQGVQEQCMAYSLDNGRTFIKYQGGAPILTRADDPTGNYDFRDPKVGWLEEEQKWLMAVAGGPLRLYSSTDLINWEFESSYAANQTVDDNSISAIYTECPDLFSLTVEGTDTDKWVLSMGGRYYRVGDLKKVGGKIWFIPETEAISMNFGKDSYAAQTYYGAPDGRRIMINWMNTWEYCGAITSITDPYNGFFTLQAELSLCETKSGIRLVQTPIKEYESLRNEKEKTVLTTRVEPDSDDPLSNFSGNSYELIAVLTPDENTTSAGFELRVGNEQKTVVSYDFENGILTVDRSLSGQLPIGSFADKTSVSVATEEYGMVRLHMFVDASSLEIYSDNGITVGSFQIFPDSSSSGLSVYSVGGSTTVDMTVYPLNDIWRPAIEETDYILSDEFIKGISAETPGADIINGFAVRNGYVSISSAQTASTGDILTLYTFDGRFVWEKTVVVDGDVNSDGHADIRDLVALKRHLGGYKSLEQAQKKAVTDGEIDSETLCAYRRSLLE